MLTHPGGPQNMIPPRFPDPSRFLSNECGPVKCFCPTNSSRLCGRSLSARGALAFAVVSHTRLFVRMSLPDTSREDETSTFRFFLDGPSQSTSGMMPAEIRDGPGFRLLPWLCENIGANLRCDSSLVDNWHPVLNLCAEHPLSRWLLMFRSRTEHEHAGL